MEIETYLSQTNWTMAGKETIPASGAEFYTIQDLNLSISSINFLEAKIKGRLYLHQKEAIKNSLEGKNVCISTGTASGKTLPFHVAALEHLSCNPSARILAIYPMKALGREQESRWIEAMNLSGLDISVGRIDGSVKPLSHRLDVLTDSQVVILTPDIIHAWLLSNLSNKKVLAFLEQVNLIIVDEVHTYSGVFGSNSAFLFRRIQHLLKMMGKTPQIICASATIANPEKHLENLFGLNFTLVTKDSSPKHQVDIFLIEQPSTKDFMGDVVKLLSPLYEKTNSRFITFVDSRKQVELISSIIARNHFKDENDSADNEDNSSFEENEKEVDVSEDASDEDAVYVPKEVIDVLNGINVLPYRAGYEETDRAKIQERLSSGKLSGIISTSALELGIDIDYLETCVLVGVPPSSTSLRQRIGRIGRHSKGNVIVINAGSVYDQVVFANPGSLLQRPLSESTLYLENPYIQYIHALCLARLGGEHDQVEETLKLQQTTEFSSEVKWPEKFIWLCEQERAGQIPRELQSMKSDSLDSPNYTFPLRDVETQFKIEFRQGPRVESLGSLSYGQLMREAYPGAVYYYATTPYRVTKILFKTKAVLVRKEKHYTTKHNPPLHTMVFPNLQEDTYQNYAYGDLICVESHVQIRELLNGFEERRGSAKEYYKYPLSGKLNIFFDLPAFTRYYFTTSAIITHPIFNKKEVDVSVIAQFLYEAFVLLIPYERQDINFGSDKFRIAIEPFNKDDRFIAIYDQVYGSLRLTSRVLEENVLNRILLEAKQIALSRKDIDNINQQTLDAFDVLIDETNKSKNIISLGQKMSQTLGSNLVRVILPQSKGLLLTQNNEEFTVERIYFSPDGLRYEGKTAQQLVGDIRPPKSQPLVDHVKEIPGESEIGYYNLGTGLIEYLPENR